jgi:branched-chain amino acid transport system substrate-binding protein
LIRRRDLLINGTAAAVGLTLASPAVAQVKPIRLGFMASLSGPGAIVGTAVLTGAEVGVDLLNRAGGIDGRQVELVVMDDKGRGESAIGLAQELFGQDIRILFGFSNSTVVLALTPLLADAKAVLLTCASSVDSLNHENFVPGFFRTNANAYMINTALAQVAVEKGLENDTWVGVFPDYLYGHNAYNRFASVLKRLYKEKAGKEVNLLPPILTKYGQPDFKTQITQLAGMPATGMFSGLNGSDGVTFWTQAKTYNLSKQYKCIIDAGSEFLLAKPLGRNVPENMWSMSYWYYGQDPTNPMSKALYDASVARLGDKMPPGYFQTSHAALQAIATGINGSKSMDAAGLIPALESSPFETAKGPRRFRKEDHQADDSLHMIRLNPQVADPGFQVSEAYVVRGAGVMEPASPGKPLLVPDSK